MNPIQSAARFYTIHTLSPLHVGSGTGVGLIDMPIMRERETKWPLIPGSTMKGTLRAYVEHAPSGSKADIQAQAWNVPTRELAKQWFGAGGDDELSAGSLVISDARLLAFPVASGYGTFAYVTCPLAIRRFARDARAIGVSIPHVETEHLKDEDVWVLEPNAITSEYKAVGSTEQGRNGSAAARPGTTTAADTSKRNIQLDEFKGLATIAGKQPHDGSASFINWAKEVSDLLFPDSTDHGKPIDRKEDRHIWQQHIALVPDDVFQYLVEMCCQVEAKIRIEPHQKTVVDGALWYEEYIPTEAILYGMLWNDSTDDVATSQLPFQLLSQANYVQIGGNSTTGRGRVEFIVQEVR
ncbi:type III-B CRISPR module RAMP protein Cmr4 [Paenibacillus campi]|uniref:type III-B CRISPR module RAMP protein Cmr4 n=1 Tax=Paenibacillus campi TaxID=3106031 RepID=UPI002B00386D|nr:type III-B CRISPR module RAMP protein Cmr4 [Paenibacillus sp. SGZ-1014]